MTLQGVRVKHEGLLVVHPFCLDGVYDEVEEHVQLLEDKLGNSGQTELCYQLRNVRKKPPTALPSKRTRNTTASCTTMICFGQPPPSISRPWK